MSEAQIFRDVVSAGIGMGLPLLFATFFGVMRMVRMLERLVELGEARERLEHSALAQRMTEETLSQWWRRTR